jgi:hypothetical protein
MVSKIGLFCQDTNCHNYHEPGQPFMRIGGWDIELAFSAGGPGAWTLFEKS